MEKNFKNIITLRKLWGYKEQRQPNRDKSKGEVKMADIMNGKMNDAELEQVAGGITYYYKRIHGTWKDPVTGRQFQDGYLVRGADIKNGQRSSSFWIALNEWKGWRERMEWRGNDFVEGDSNPNGVDSAPPPAPAPAPANN